MDSAVTKAAETGSTGSPAARSTSSRSDAAQLAAAALQTLSELGYARTSLREIAQNSEFSHGVLHYYFTDKVDLITYCVRQYKARVRAPATTRSSPPPAPRTSSCTASPTAWPRPCARTRSDAPPLVRPAHHSRCSRSPSAPTSLEIDESLERMIWRIVSRYAELSGRPAGRLPLGGVRASSTACSSRPCCGTCPARRTRCASSGIRSTSSSGTWSVSRSLPSRSGTRPV